MQQQYSTPDRSFLSQSIAPVANGNAVPTSYLKAVIVDVLGLLLAWKPTLAMCLGRLVLRLWPGMREV